MSINLNIYRCAPYARAAKVALLIAPESCTAHTNMFRLAQKSPSKMGNESIRSGGSGGNARCLTYIFARYSNYYKMLQDGIYDIPVEMGCQEVSTLIVWSMPEFACRFTKVDNKNV